MERTFTTINVSKDVKREINKIKVESDFKTHNEVLEFLLGKNQNE